MSVAPSSVKADTLYDSRLLLDHMRELVGHDLRFARAIGEHNIGTNRKRVGVDRAGGGVGLRACVNAHIGEGVSKARLKKGPGGIVKGLAR